MRVHLETLKAIYICGGEIKPLPPSFLRIGHVDGWFNGIHGTWHGCRVTAESLGVTPIWAAIPKVVDGNVITKPIKGFISKDCSDNVCWSCERSSAPYLYFFSYSDEDLAMFTSEQEAQDYINEWIEEHTTTYSVDAMSCVLRENDVVVVTQSEVKILPYKQDNHPVGAIYAYIKAKIACVEGLGKYSAKDKIELFDL